MDLSSIPDRFSAKKIIGQGNFGVIYKSLDSETNENVAIKLIKSRNGIQELQNEVKIISRLQGGNGIPKLIWSSRNSNFYIMELLGCCINDKFIKQNRIMSSSNFIIIAEQLLERLEFIHSRSVIHRDLKPHQLVLGGPKHKKVYLIDYGLSKLFESQNGCHIPYSEGRPFVGTFNYASLNAHLGLQQSRRDDLESYCYILAYFLTGDLPWKINHATQNETAIKKMKLSIKSYEIFPDEVSLGKIFNYIRSLKFDQKPDYHYIQSLLSLYKKKFPSLICQISWKLTRHNSMRGKSKKSEKRLKRLKSVNVEKIVDSEDHEMSLTKVTKEYPEFKTHKNTAKKKRITEAPTTDTLKTSTDASCCLF